MSIKDRIVVALDVLKNGVDDNTVGAGSYYSPQMSAPFVRSTVDSFASSAFNRIAVDCSAVNFHHVKIDPNTDKEKTIQSELTELLKLDTNIDQTFKDFIRDCVKSMFSEGSFAITPISVNGKLTLRVGYIRQWYPRHVELDLWNEKQGKRDHLRVLKEDCAIIENPLYSVTSGSNSTLKRLIEKMNQIDQIDAIAASGKLDLILQLPQAMTHDKFIKDADGRIEDIQSQLKNNRMGIAYIGANEQITQLNRPVSDTILPQIDKLTEAFHNQLGLTANVLNGTANETEMRAYYSRTIDPILTAIVEAMTKAFIKPANRKQGEKIVYYRDPFALVPMSQLPDLLDKAGRNEYLTPNEGRRIMGFKPHSDPEADELKNRNMAPKGQAPSSSSRVSSDPDEVEEPVKMGTNTDEGESE